MIYSYMTLPDLIRTICKLSTVERKMIVESTVVDQPRNMKIGAFEVILQDLIQFPKSLDYYLSLVNGYVLMTLNATTLQYNFNFVVEKVIALAKKGHSIKLSIEVLGKPKWKFEVKESDKKYLGFAQYKAINSAISSFEQFEEFRLTMKSVPSIRGTRRWDG